MCVNPSRLTRFLVLEDPGGFSNVAVRARGRRRGPAEAPDRHAAARGHSVAGARHGGSDKGRARSMDDKVLVKRTLCFEYCDGFETPGGQPERVICY